MALGLQKPADLIGTALVMRGAPGTGKSFLADRYRALWGIHYIAITQASHVLGRFNGHLTARRLVFIDEGMFGGNRREAGVIKTRITEPQIILEQKGVDPVKMVNRALYVVASNEDSVVPADLGDRRLMVLDVSAKRKEDHDFFAGIMEEMQGGGYEAMMFELLHRDLAKGPDPRRTIKTDALLDQVLRAQPPYVQYLHHILEEARLPQNRVAGSNVTTIRALIEELWRLHPAERHMTTIALGRKIRQIFPSARTDHNGRYLTRYQSDGSPEFETSTRYVFPALATARKEFEKHLGSAVPWDNSVGDWVLDPAAGAGLAQGGPSSDIGFDAI